MYFSLISIITVLLYGIMMLLGVIKLKNIFIILTQPMTSIARLLRFFSHDKFNHASICIDENFSEFYSFGRIFVNTPLFGGFLVETAFTHVFGKYDNIPCMVLRKSVSDEEFNIIKATISEFVENPKKYKYDKLNLLLAKTSISFPRHNKFFCSGFVAYVLERANIRVPNIREKIRPMQFLELEGIEVIYEGELHKWCKNPATMAQKSTSDN